MLPVGTNLDVAKPPKAVLTLIGINIAVFVLQSIVPADTLKGILDSYAFRPQHFNPLSLITSMFLHGDFFHIFGNMLYLWLFGGPVEERIGARLFTYYYFGAGLWSTALFGLIEVIAHPEKQIGAIGASGAISGIMALFLYRCYYGKIKMTLPVVPTFLFAPWARFSLPAAPLLIFWFLRDFFGGLQSLHVRSGIAYWGHVGGFLFGLAVGRIKRYGHEGQLEQAKKKLFEKISSGFGWKTNNAEEELLNLLALAPRDPEVHQQLAHYYMETGKPKQAEEHYQQAVNQFFLSDPVAAAFTVIDHADSLKKTMGLHLHLKAAETLLEKAFIEDAYRVLQPAMGKGEDGVIAERAGLLFVRVCRALGKDDEATKAAQQFTVLFPVSRFANEVAQVLSLTPETVFPPKKEVPGPRRPEIAEAGEESNALLTIMHGTNRLITDPFFLFIWIFMLSWGSDGGVKSITFTFLFALFIVSFYRVDWFHHYGQWGRKSEDAARNEVEITTAYDRAVLAEKGENFEKAAHLYEKLLTMDPGNIQAHFNLSRIYLSRLQDNENGIRQLKKLKKAAPPDHPYQVFADDEIRNMTKRYKGEKKGEAGAAEQ